MAEGRMDFRGFVQDMGLALGDGACENFDSDRNRALMLEIIIEHSRCVKKLLQAGADVNFYDPVIHKTPLLEAIKCSSSECVKVLVEAGADVNVVDIDNCNALCLAVKKGNTQMVNSIIAAGVDVNALCNDGTSALFTGTERDRSECVRVLLEAGAFVNTTDTAGNTPLMLAASESDDVERIKTLLRNNCLINVANQNGQNALECFLSRQPLPDNLIIGLYLYAAGEEITGSTIKVVDTVNHFVTRIHIPIFFENLVRVHSLKDACRLSIRKLLLGGLKRHYNLFLRIAQLALPGTISRYLLFNLSLAPE